MSKSDWNHIHKVYVTQIHHDTLFFDPIFAKNIQILAENIHFSFVKIPHFWLFSGVLEVKLKLQDKFYAIFDHNKCPSSEKEDEKCILRKSYFHQIQPRYRYRYRTILKLKCCMYRVINNSCLFIDASESL